MIRASMKSTETMIAALIIGMLMLASAPALAQDPDIQACTAASKRLLEREVRDSARRQAIALSNRAWAWCGHVATAVFDPKPTSSIRRQTDIEHQAANC
jgi:hypothetical protein